ncbi:hypothetical protein BC831DRAFT_441250 [Entophlyctis helioformis]|nr:hypothetical protein BC831DRAFT_441250 [Entophlyctis helioformis]
MDPLPRSPVQAAPAVQAAHLSQALVTQLVPVLQALDMGIIAAVRSQADLHVDMERLAAGASIGIALVWLSGCLAV